MPPTEVLDAAADGVVDDSAVTEDTSPTLSMDSADESNVLTIHEAIQRVGYGTFQKRLLLVSGLMFMAVRTYSSMSVVALSSYSSCQDAVEVMLLSFLQVLVKDEWHLTSTQQAGITAAVFAGELPGALFWGFFADKYGRRLGFLLSALCIAVFGIWSAFVPTVWWLMACRAMVGFGVSGNRLCATPLVLVLCSFPWMPESPKWLVDQHRYDEAIHVLEATAKLNGATLPYNVRIRPLESKGFVTPFIADSESMSVAGVCGIYGTCLLLTTAACYLLPPDSIDPDLLVVCDTACELVALTTEEDSSVGKASD
ncbi:hypothetical protein DYB30_011335 [Aphanomyces astaci]|uniref:Major facilitator superfamily (MFS) profile domain-containing protein n=1 Tax=Aphanomyces astaci TaxID=112090 RepID=A0A397D852_APHAT|nr:hypothetical protein DYB30_011335 [Aphanomyces astaci]